MEIDKNEIQLSFDATLKDTDLAGLIVDVAELGIDSLFDEGMLQDIPIIRTLVSLSKFGANIHDKLFLKKVLSFLTELNDVSIKDRNEMINDIDESKQYRVKVGEKLLYVIDSCRDFENSERVARVFKALLEEKIDYDDFLSTANILEKITDQDFRWFIKNVRNSMKVEDIGSLVSAGLFDLYFDPVEVTVDEEDDYERALDGGKYKTEVDGGDMYVTLSRAGEVIMEVFNPDYKKPRTAKI